MTGPEAPERLARVAAPGSTLAGGLAAARLRGPSDAQLRALESALAATLGAAATGAAVSASIAKTAGSPAAPAFASAGALKLTAVLVSLAAVAGGVAAYRHELRARPLTAIAAAPVAPPSAAPASQPVAAAPPTAPSFSAERTVGASRPRRRAAVDELALIARAQRTLAGDPATALALIEDNRRVLAQSSFAQEAEVIAVAALARLGRSDEAAARAARFVARFPDSVHVARMRRVAGIIK